MLSKQAKTLTDAQLQSVLQHVAASRYPLRDRAMVLLSFKAGLRAKEISAITWGMVTDSDGNLAAEISLPNSASKGKRGGRHIPMQSELRAALVALRAARGDCPADSNIITSERRSGLLPGAIHVWFSRVFAAAQIQGASSHSGRRTFLTTAARKIMAAGGSLKDVQDLAGHASIATTQRYIDASEEAKRRLIAMM